MFASGTCISLTISSQLHVRFGYFCFMKNAHVYYYILDGHTPKPVENQNILQWAMAFETMDRSVGNTIVGNYHVSTVFLGLDHNFFGPGPPVLFETCIFDDSKPVASHFQPGEFYVESEVVWRGSTWEEAEAEHARVVSVLVEDTGKDAVEMPRQMMPS